MKKHLAIAALFTLGLIPLESAASEESETTMIALHVTLAKNEFTDLETIHGVIEGSFASDCLQLEDPLIFVAPARVDIQPRAFRNPKTKICHNAFVPWLQSIEIPKLPPGQHLLTLGVAGLPQIITVVPHVEQPK